MSKDVLRLENILSRTSGIPIKYVDFQEVRRVVSGGWQDKSWGLFSPTVTEHGYNHKPEYEVTIKTADNRAMRFYLPLEEYSREITQSYGGWFFRHTSTDREVHSNRLIKILTDRITGNYTKKSGELLDFEDNTELASRQLGKQDGLET